MQAHSQDKNHAAPDWGRGDSNDLAGFITLREILFPRALPDPLSISDMEMPALMCSIELELLEKQVQLDFLDKMPARIAYRGLIQLLDSPLPRPRNALETLHVDGCDSACETCFQLAYCSIARDYLGEEWRIAIEHAGTNPSWTSLGHR
jgi:hypothetical protein